MKRFMRYGLVLSFQVLCFAVLASCGTPPRQYEKNAGQEKSFEILNPPDIVGKLLAGTDHRGEYGLMLLGDGRFLYKNNNTVYEGVWSFDGTAKIYRYRLDWLENGKPQGYLMDFGENEQEIVWVGQWYLSDEYRPFFKMLAVLEQGES